MTNTMKVNYTEAEQILSNMKMRSAWNNGVKEYAKELLESLKESEAYNEAAPATRAAAIQIMLNGAKNWSQYSWGGCSLIYNCDIAERLCNPSELKRTHNGERRPNNREEWLDTQARALYQAQRLINNILF